MVEKCVGCGAIIQTTNPEAKGYIDKEVYKKHQEDFYCQRCFNLRHYNRNFEYTFDSNAYQKNLEMIKESKGLIVYVIDLFDLEGTLFNNINEIFKTDNLLIVLNKVDIYLNSLNLHKLETYVRQFLKSRKIKYQDLVIMSSFKQSYILTLIEKIKLYKDHKDVFFVGMTNVGKSSIINQIIKLYTRKDNIITVSNIMNTTLDNIYIPFDEESYLVDTPGLINKNHLMNFLDKKTIDLITPKSYIRPKTYQLNPGQTLFIAGFLRLDFESGSRSTFVTNFRNDLLIHRTKLENAEEFYENHLDDILKIPNPEERVRLGELKETVFNIDLSEKKDLVISGLGYISIIGYGNIRITTFNNINIVIRKAIL